MHDVITLRAGEQAQEIARTFLPRVAETGIPVLVLHGTEDPIADCDKSRSLEASGVDVKTFEGMRHHLLQETGGDEVRQAILGWLEEKLPR